MFAVVISITVYEKGGGGVSWTISSNGGVVMQRRLRAAAALLTVALAVSTAGPLTAQTNKSSEGSMPKVGDMAPDFKLQYFDGNDLKDVSLSQYRGKKNVVLAFYIFAFTGG